jgi:hypothetical protein
VTEKPPPSERPSPPAPGARDRRTEGERFFQLSLFWRERSLWPVTACAIAGLGALGAGAVSMAITQRNPFARGAVAIAALLTLFGMWDWRSRKGKLGGGAVVAAVLWALSIAGGVLLARSGG